MREERQWPAVDQAARVVQTGLAARTVPTLLIPLAGHPDRRLRPTALRRMNHLPTRGKTNANESFSMRVTIRPATQNQVLAVRFQVRGLPFVLAYRSDLGPGRRAAYQWDLSGTTEPGTVTVDGRAIPAAAGRPFVWDGLDSADNPISYSTRAVLSGSSDQPTRSTILGRWDARTLGLGGLTAGGCHHLDPRLRVIYLGEGRLRSQVAAGKSDGHYVVASRRGSYMFDLSGRHTETRRSGAALPHAVFAYENGRLSALRQGNTSVAVERETGRVTFANTGVSLDLGEDGRATTIHDRTGAVHLLYGDTGLLEGITDALGTPYRFGYDPLGRLLSVEDPTRHSFDIVIQEDGKRRRVGTVTRGGRETARTVERHGDGSKTITDQCCGQVPTVTTVTGNLEEVARSDGTRVERTRRGHDTHRTVVLPSGLVAESAAWEAARRPSIDPETGTRTVTTPAGRQSSVAVDGQGRPTLIEVPGLPSRSLQYDDRGRLTSYGNAAVTFSIERDAEGRTSRVAANDGESTSFSYDPAGRLIYQETAGRQVKIDYDGGDQVVGITNARGHRVGFTYESGRRVADVFAPIGGSSDPTVYAYDSDGLLESMRLADGRTIDFESDASGRPLRQAWDHTEVQFRYDESAGRLVGIEGPGQAGLNFEYDGPLTTVITQTGPAPGRLHLEYGADLLVSKVMVGDHTVEMERDADGLLLRVGPLRIERDPDTGAVTAKEAGNARLEFTSNESGAPALMRLLYLGTLVYEAAYQTDARRRVLSVAERSEFFTATTHYGYDGGRLVSASIGDASWRVEHDANGNVTRVASPHGDTEAEFDARDRMTRRGVQSLAYTPDGMLKQIEQDGKTTSFSHDPWGRLVSVKQPGGASVEWLLDGLGRKVVSLVDGQPKWRLLYEDRLRPIAAVGAEGEVDSLYLRSSDELTPDLIVRDGVVLLVVVDHVGSPRLVIDTGTGEVVQETRFGPFGATLENTDPGLHPFGFAGGLSDGLTELVHFRARSYSPALGRWTSRDPFLFRGGHPNFYVYAGGDPVNLQDRSGTQLEDSAGPQLELCRRATNMGYESLDGTGMEHWWIRGKDVEAGMTDSPNYNWEGAVGDHTGAGDLRGSNCEPIENVDPECVTEQLATNKIHKTGFRYGRELGLWVPGVNTCQDFVKDVLDACASGGEPTVVTDDEFDHWWSPDIKTRPPEDHERYTPSDPPPDHSDPDDGGYTPAGEPYTPADYTPSEGGGLWE